MFKTFSSNRHTTSFQNELSCRNDFTCKRCFVKKVRSQVKICNANFTKNDYARKSDFKRLSS